MLFQTINKKTFPRIFAIDIIFSLKSRYILHKCMFFIILYYVRVAILLTFGKQLHDGIITLRFGAHSTSLTTPPYTEVPTPSQKNDESSICVLEVSNVLFSTSFLLDIGVALTE